MSISTQFSALTPTAAPDDIKKSYRRLALIHHPDKHASSSEDKKKENSSNSSKLATRMLSLVTRRGENAMTRLAEQMKEVLGLVLEMMKVDGKPTLRACSKKSQRRDSMSSKRNMSVRGVWVKSSIPAD
jgi:hypothetical protein